MGDTKLLRRFLDDVNCVFGLLCFFLGASDHLFCVDRFGTWFFALTCLSHDVFFQKCGRNFYEDRKEVNIGEMDANKIVIRSITLVRSRGFSYIADGSCLVKHQKADYRSFRSYECVLA